MKKLLVMFGVMFCLSMSSFAGDTRSIATADTTASSETSIKCDDPYVERAYSDCKGCKSKPEASCTGDCIWVILDNTGNANYCTCDSAALAKALGVSE